MCRPQNVCSLTGLSCAFVACCRDSGEFDSTQLSALKEFLPNDDERKALQAYMKKGEASPQAAAEALSHLSECEKYMVAMMKVDNAASKFDCMLFRVQFKGRIDEIIEGINIVNKACEEVRSSDRLRKMMAMILTLVNQINTGGDGNLAVGFSLDALLKLNEVRLYVLRICGKCATSHTLDLKRRQRHSIKRLAYFSIS